MVTRALIFLALTLSSHIAFSATFSAEVDRYQITTEEHLSLKLTLTHSDTRLRAQGISPNIDLSLLTHSFDLGTPHAENHFNIYRNHGRSTSSISIDLFPKQAGTFTIPSFSVDDLKTDPIIINVIDTQSTVPEIFIESGLSHSSVWLNQQFIAYIDLYHRVELSEAKLGGKLDTEPLITDAIKLPQSERQENSKGFNFNVTRIAWAIYPPHSGKQTLYLPDLWVITKSGRKQRFPVQKKIIEVKPLPEAISKNLIVGPITLNQTELDNTPAVGQLSSWTVILNSTAKANTLPQTLKTLTSAPALKIYRDIPVTVANKTPEALDYTATYHFSLMPITAGTYTLPSMEIPFFNPEAGQIEKATLNSFTIQVPPSLTQNPQAITLPTEAHSPESLALPNSSLIWQWLTLIFALLCMIILILWQRERFTYIKKVTTQSTHSKPAPSSSSKALLLDAFNSQTLEQGLSQWEQYHAIDTEIRGIVSTVQKASYGRGEVPDNATIKRIINKIKKSPAIKNPDISKESFYP